MIKAIATIKGVTPYSQSKKISDRQDKETGADHEKRCWRERCHVDTDGNVFIPAMAFKNCISEAAKFLSMQVPGKGKSTYTKHFEAGVMTMDHLPLNIHVDDVPGEWLFVPADGRRGGPKRVDKCFPIIHQWGGQVIFYITDEAITREVFERHLKEAGNLIGIGRFRPRNNGYYGRFVVEDLTWEKYV